MNFVLCTSGECLYNTEEQLFMRVMKFCHNLSAARDAKIEAIVCMYIYICVCMCSGLLYIVI